MKKNSTHCCSFWAMICHFSSLAGFILPGFSIIAPLIVWGMRKDKDPLVEANGRNVINFVLSFWLYLLILGIICVPMMFFLLIPLVNLIAIFFLGISIVCGIIYSIIYLVCHIILPIYGGIKAYNGEVYRYPLTIAFLKETPASPPKKKSSAK